MVAYFFLAIPVACWVIAALNDVYELKIPNWISLVLIITFPFAGLYNGMSLVEIGSSFALAMVVLIAGFALFALNTIGGGDAKILAASAPWIGVSVFGLFFFKVALVGGGLAVLLLLFRRAPALPVYAQADWVMRLHQDGTGLPYGVAIAIGGLWSLPETRLFSVILAG